MKAKLAIYDKFDLQLHKMAFYNYMDLYIETKSSDEAEFEEYDPNWLFLRILKYVEDTKYDFSR